MMNRYITILFTALMSISVFSQDPCGTTQYMDKLISDDPSYIDRLFKMEIQIAERIANGEEKGTGIITIPVVFHVLRNVWDVYEVTDEDIYSQLDAINRDFNLNNNDYLISKGEWEFEDIIGNMRINFCMAEFDPDGNPTNGIERKSGKLNLYNQNNKIKFDSLGGLDAWDTEKYLNIWVGNLRTGLYGYAQYPGGPPATDGVVIDHMVCGQVNPDLFPNYTKGRILVHEIGHWLNLRHIWGDCNCCNDFVDDTPTQSGPHKSWECHLDTIITCGSRDIVHNYMDYVGDTCMFMFTKGQVLRAHASLDLFRQSIINNGMCEFVSVTEEDPLPEVSFYPNPVKEMITVEFDRVQTFDVSIVDMRGRVIKSVGFDNTNRITLNVNGLYNGVYLIKIQLPNSSDIITQKFLIQKGGASLFGGIKRTKITLIKQSMDE